MWEAAKAGKIHHAHGLEELTLKNIHTTQGNLQIQHNPYRDTNGIFYRTRTNFNLKICMESQKTPNSQNNLKEEQSWKYHAPWFQTVLQSYSNHSSMVLALRTDTHRSMNRIESSAVNWR